MKDEWGWIWKVPAVTYVIVLHQYLRERAEENHEKCLAGRDSKPESLEYEVEVPIPGLLWTVKWKRNAIVLSGVTGAQV
jgi:hypothetical protein